MAKKRKITAEWSDGISRHVHDLRLRIDALSTSIDKLEEYDRLIRHAGRSQYIPDGVVLWTAIRKKAHSLGGCMYRLEQLKRVEI